MRVIVTGASGFLGRALMAHLRESGIDAIGVHRRGAAPGMISVKDYAQAPGGDVLVHLAENGDRSKVAKLGMQFVTEVQDRLKQLLDGRYKHIVYASSSLIYASSDAPLAVGDALDTRDFYAAGKHACETLTLDAGGIVLRLSNLYGAGQTGETVINTILEQLPATGPVTLRDTRPVRDFLAASDAAAAIEMAIQWRGSDIFNIGSGVGTSIGDLARLLCELSGNKDRTVIATNPSGAPSRFVLDIAETTRTTGWAPRLDLRQGLKRLLIEQEQLG